MEVILNGEDGKIQADYYRPKGGNKKIAVVFHNHPSLNSSMNDKLTYTLFHSFASKGFNTLRFNFRGVGNSHGTFTNGEGELSDAANVLDWLQNLNEDAEEIWVSGIGFGAWVALQVLMRRPEITNFLVLSPPVKKYDFSFAIPCACNGLIIQGLGDTTINEEQVKKFATNLNKPKGIDVIYKTIPDADNKFISHIDEVRKIITNYLDENA